MKTAKANIKDLNAVKLEFVKEFLNEGDENLVKEQISFYHSMKYTDGFFKLPRTKEELKASVVKAEEDYRKGIFFSMDEIFEKYSK